jgi:hypothetical protein
VVYMKTERLNKIVTSRSAYMKYITTYSSLPFFGWHIFFLHIVFASAVSLHIVHSPDVEDMRSHGCYKGNKQKINK